MASYDQIDSYTYIEQLPDTNHLMSINNGDPKEAQFQIFDISKKPRMVYKSVLFKESIYLQNFDWFVLL